MKEICRFRRDLGGLLAAIVGLVLVTVTLGALATHAEGPATKAATAAAQNPSPTPSARPTATVSPTPTPVNWSTDPMLKRFVWRGIGPASMGGRIDDIAAVESNPYIYYVGFATGGVWKTTNNGTTFQPVFDTY